MGELLVRLTPEELRKLVADAVREAMSAPQEPRLLTGPEACKLLGVSRDHLRKLRAAGMPVHRLGPQTVRYVAAEILAWSREAAE